MVRLREAGIVLVLVVISLILRQALQNDGLFHHDAVKLAMAVEATHDSGRLHPMELQIPPVGGRWGLVLVNWGAYAAIHTVNPAVSTEAVLLFTSALFGSLAVGLLYLVGRMSGLGVAICVGGATLLSLDAVFFSETVGAKGHGLALAGALLGILLAQVGARGRSPTLAVASGLILGLIGFVRESSILAAAPALLILFFESRERRAPLVAAFAIAFGGAVAGFVVVQMEWIRTFSAVTDYRVLDLHLVSLALADVNRVITPAGWPLLLVGIGVAVRERRPLPLVVWMVGGFAYFANLGQYSSRFLIEVLAVASLLVAAGAHVLLRRWRLAYPAAIVLLGVLPYVLPLQSPTIWNVIAYRHHRIGNEVVGRYLLEETPEDAVVIAMDDAPFVQYYGQRATLSHPIPDPADPVRAEEETRAFARQVYDLLVGGRPVYLLWTGLTYDPGQYVNRALGSIAVIDEVARIESEDYHDKSIRSGRYEQIIFRLRLKTPTGP
jgi:hypothetical protein